MTQDVSIHAPITRLLAASHKSLFKHSIKYNDFKLIEDEKVRMNALIEPSLRSIAMASQINVGLWRRNGYSLLRQVLIHMLKNLYFNYSLPSFQVYFYQNVKCRSEMYDRDVECLQLGASIMDSNEFMVSILSRYRLIDYINKYSFISMRVYRVCVFIFIFYEIETTLKGKPTKQN